MRARRAFIFTADAVLAFYLITIILSILMLLSYTPKLYTQQFQSVARDTVVALSTIRLRDVWGSPQYNYTNSLLSVRNNTLTLWPMFLRTIDHSTSIVSAYPKSNYVWLTYLVSPVGATTGVHSTPVLYNGKIIATSENGIYAFDENNGTRLWFLPICSDSTPLLYNGRIFVGSLNSSFYSLDEMGNVVWNATLDGSVISSPIAHNGKVFMGTANGSLVSFDVESGFKSWSFSTPGNITSSPIFYNGNIIIFSNDTSNMGHLYALDEYSGALMWSYNQGLSQPIDIFTHPSPIVSNDVIYYSDEWKIHALITTTLSELNGWPVNQVGLSFTSSPALDNNMLYIGCSNVSNLKKGVCIINTTSSQPLLSLVLADLGSSVYSTPLVVNDSVITATYDGTLRVVNKSALLSGTVQPLWSYTATKPIYSSPAVVNGRIYVGADDGNIYSFGNCSLWDDNMSVIDSIAAFWSINRTDCARAIAKEFLDSAVPQNYGFELVIKPPEGTGLQCSRIFGNSCYYCNGTNSTKWDSIYTNDCDQTKYQRLLIRDSRYISGLLRKNSGIYYAQSPIEVELRVWN
ncbi:PQQ-binding-like beta-propeller repeat protein [Candidatus Micrarchaeota archaeon]|nr:PQQ-binding-like beta-propeller repeat protein [Candidatus Micrarchaeota archaeon]